ncbi:MAG: hypothetical protein MUD01_27180, partial [Chloroflexaceae bacterium]|nr:hypothetical protein [Chloroflexaceae bacterium]
RSEDGIIGAIAVEFLRGDDMQEQLQPLVQQAQRYPQLLATYFARYQTRYDLSVEDLCGLLDLKTPYELQLLNLSLAPEFDSTCSEHENWLLLIQWCERCMSYVQVSLEAIVRIVFDLAPNTSINFTQPLPPPVQPQPWSLVPLAAEARAYPQLLASAISKYQTKHQLTDKEMRKYLKIGRPNVFALVQLCDASTPNRHPYIRCNRRAVQRIKAQTDHHLFWEEHPKGGLLWCQSGPYRGQIAGGDYGTCFATITTPTRRIKAPTWYESLNAALDWCEQTIDQLPIYYGE